MKYLILLNTIIMARETDSLERSSLFHEADVIVANKLDEEWTVIKNRHGNNVDKVIMTRKQAAEFLQAISKRLSS